MNKLVAFGVLLLLALAGVYFLVQEGRRPGVLLIGIDGADWDVLDPLIEAGRLPHLGRLKEEGVSGELMTLRDIPLSPVIWTSVATGKGPDQHGITWFLVDTPDGKRIPVRSYNRKVEALWNILAANERVPAFVGWWATAPAEPVGRGVIASDALGFHGFGRTGQGLPDEEKVYPPALYDRLSVMVPPIQQVDYSYGERFFHMSAEEYYDEAYSPTRYRMPDPANPIHLFQQYTATSIGYTAIAKLLLEEHAPDLLGVYYESSDSMSHLFMKYAPPRQDWIAEDEYARYKDVVDTYYEFVDEQVGALLASVPDDWGVVVVSDHGFRIGENRPKSVDTVDMRGAHLDHEPEGVFVARGPQFKRGATIQGATVLDVAPTLLHALGLPVARDMTGRVLADVFVAGYVDANPIAYVATYEKPGGRERTASGRTREAFAAEQAMAQLEALGYAGSEAEPPGGAEPGDPGKERDSSPEIHNNLGRIHLGKGEVDEALAEFEAALRLQPGNPEALTNIGMVRLIQGRQDLALGAFNEALRNNPNNVAALVKLAEIRKDQGDLRTAAALYRQVLAIDDRLPDPYNGLGDAMLRQGKAEGNRELIEQAKALFQKAIELDPLLALAHYNLGVAHAELGEKEAAKAAYEKALELAPDDPHVLNNVGDQAFQEGRVEDALALWRRAAESAPWHMESRFNIGSILGMQGEHEEAVRWLEEAAALAPDHFLVQQRLAIAYMEKGDLGEARRRFESQTRIYPVEYEPCLHLARISAREGKAAEAAQWLRIAHERGGPGIESVIRADPELSDLDLDAILGAGK